MGGKILPALRKACGNDRTLALDEPWEFKGVTFYPVAAAEAYEFYSCVDVLLVEQAHMRDKVLLRLPYLWFLCYASEHWERYERRDFATYMPFLYGVLMLAARREDIEVKAGFDDGGMIRACSLMIGESLFNDAEFAEIRKMILLQAGIEKSEDTLNEDTAREIQRGREFENERSGYVPPTLEDLTDILAMYLQKDPAEIRGFTLRRFNRLLKHLSRFEEYKLQKGGEYSGMVKFEKPIPHWVGGFEKEDPLKGQNIIN